HRGVRLAHHAQPLRLSGHRAVGRASAARGDGRTGLARRAPAHGAVRRGPQRIHALPMGRRRARRIPARGDHRHRTHQPLTGHSRDEEQRTTTKADMDLSVITRTCGPVLRWCRLNDSPLDRTRPVCSNSVNKGFGLFGDYYLGPDFTLIAPLQQGLHWRELLAIISVLLAEGRVVIGSTPPDVEHVAIVALG